MDKVAISHKTLFWLGQMAGVGPHELISKFKLSGLSCCVEPGVAGGQIQKCFDTGTGQCLLTWVSPEGVYPGVPSCVGGQPPGCGMAPPPPPPLPPAPPTPPPTVIGPPPAGSRGPLDMPPDVLLPPPSVIGPPPLAPPPMVAPPPAPPPVPVITPIIDWTTPRRPRPPGVWVIGPFGPFLAPVAPTEAPTPAPVRPRPVPAPIVIKPVVVGVPVNQVKRLLDVCEAALEAAHRAIERGARCRATDGEREAARVARACLADLNAAAGAVGEVMDELCAASKAGREAMLTERQVAALEAFVVCAQTVAGAEESQNWLTAVIGAGLPAAGSIAMAVL